LIALDAKVKAFNGTRIGSVSTQYCRSCGNSIEDGAKFCIDCGSAIAGTSTNSSLSDDIVQTRDGTLEKVNKAADRFLPVAMLKKVSDAIDRALPIEQQTQAEAQHNDKQTLHMANYCIKCGKKFGLFNTTYESDDLCHNCFEEENPNLRCKECGAKLNFFTKVQSREGICLHCFNEENLARIAEEDEELAGTSVIIMEARGVNGRIQLLDDRVRILRKGVISLALQGIKGDKEIPINQVGAIKFKNAGLTAGYMIFTFLGSQEYKGGLFGELYDENGVAFYPNHQREFEAMKAAIEQKMAEARRPAVQQIQRPSAYDELAKLAALRDQGIVTEQEFQEQKRKLLGS